MGKKILSFILCLVFFASLFFGGYYLGTRGATGKLDTARNELADTRTALDATRNGNADLERRLAEIADIASASAGTVDNAIVEAGRITDSTKRIKLLIGAIRATLASLYDIMEKGTGTEKP
jgi:hypothetical protein